MEPKAKNVIAFNWPFKEDEIFDKAEKWKKTFPDSSNLSEYTLVYLSRDTVTDEQLATMAQALAP